MKWTVDRMFDFLWAIEVPEDAINVMEAVNGVNEKTATDILYWWTGHKDFDVAQEEYDVYDF